VDKSSKYIFLATGGLLIVGCLPLEFTFYELLRGLVSVAAVLLGTSAVRLRQYAWLLVSVPSFTLWFPLFGFQLQNREWVYLDLVFGIFYLAAGFVLQNTRGKSSGKSDSKSE
jgi:hypothetical protein